MIDNKGKQKKPYILLVVLGLLFFMPYLGNVDLFDWDELNFAECSREMLATGDYLTVRVDYKPFHEKPPLFFWMQSASMAAFGINEFAARLPNALVGIATLLAIFAIGRRHFDDRFGLLWALAYLGSYLPHFYFKTGLIDPSFNLFMYLSCYWLSRYSSAVATNSPARNKLVAAAVLASLAVMTKGPVGFMLPVLAWAVFYLRYRRSMAFPAKDLALFTALAFAPALLWYSAVFIRGGSQVIEEFIAYQIRLLTTSDAGFSGPIYYHLVVLLIGCFPASIIALRGFRVRLDSDKDSTILKQWNIILLVVVVTIFSIVNTKIVHYSSLSYFPITFLAALAAYSICYKGLEWKRTSSWLLGTIGVLWGALLFFIPYALINTDSILPLVKDEFTREVLRSPVQWGGAEFALGIVYVAIIAVALVLIARRKMVLQGLLVLFVGTACTIFSLMPLLVPKIAEYTQGAAMEFYRANAAKEVYIHPLGIGNYKYGHLFYAAKPQQLSAYFNKNVPDDRVGAWLLDGDIDHPALFVAKVTDSEEYISKYGLELLYKKNGLAFLRRNIKADTNQIQSATNR